MFVIRTNYEDNTKYIIKSNCWNCNKVIEFDVSILGYNSWLSGEHIQNAMPEVMPEHRELLISGTCKDCFDKLDID